MSEERSTDVHQPCAPLQGVAYSEAHEAMQLTQCEAGGGRLLARLASQMTGRNGYDAAIFIDRIHTSASFGRRDADCFAWIPAEGGSIRSPQLILSGARKNFR